MGSAKRRAGATETFSVSVDAETKRALRALADSDFGGNLSALIGNFAEEARRRGAAAAYLKRHGLAKLSAGAAKSVQAAVDAELAAAPKKPRRRRAA